MREVGGSEESVEGEKVSVETSVKGGGIRGTWALSSPSHNGIKLVQSGKFSIGRSPVF